MSVDEIMAIIIGTLLLGAFLIVGGIALIINVVDDIKRKREKENYREYERRELTSCIHHIERDLYNINETLKKKENKKDEEE